MSLRYIHVKHFFWKRIITTIQQLFDIFFKLHLGIHTFLSNKFENKTHTFICFVHIFLKNFLAFLDGFFKFYDKTKSIYVKSLKSLRFMIIIININDSMQGNNILNAIVSRYNCLKEILQHNLSKICIIKERTFYCNLCYSTVPSASFLDISSSSGHSEVLHDSSPAKSS